MSYRRVRGNLKPEYLRLKEAMTVFSMGPEKIEALARVLFSTLNDASFFTLNGAISA